MVAFGGPLGESSGASALGTSTLYSSAIEQQTTAGRPGSVEPGFHHGFSAVDAVSCYVTDLRPWPRHRGSFIGELTGRVLDAIADLFQEPSYARAAKGTR
jgi:hypothetical protein